MSLLQSLAPKEGSTHYRKRLGRGRGSGLGQTSGKGHKGQLARTGGKVRRGFEGGQSPLQRRMPKFGFNNSNFEQKFQPVNLSQLEKLNVTEVTPEYLIENKIIKSLPIKILANGTLSKKIVVKAHAFSETAKKAIEQLGGTAEVIK